MFCSFALDMLIRNFLLFAFYFTVVSGNLVPRYNGAIQSSRSNYSDSTGNTTIDNNFPYIIPFDSKQSCNIFGPLCQPGSITVNSIGTNNRTSSATLPCSSYLSSQAKFIPISHVTQQQEWEKFMFESHVNQKQEWVREFGRSPECRSFAKMVSKNDPWIFTECQGNEATGTVEAGSPDSVPAQVPTGLAAPFGGPFGGPCCGKCDTMLPELRLYYFPDPDAAAWCAAHNRTLLKDQTMASNTSTQDLKNRGLVGDITPTVTKAIAGSTTVISGHILTSPSIYLEVVGTLVVFDDCGTIGTPMPNAFIAVPPGGLSTIEAANWAYGEVAVGHHGGLQFSEAVTKPWTTGDPWYQHAPLITKTMEIAELECPTGGVGITGVPYTSNSEVLTEWYTTIGSPYLPYIVAPRALSTLQPIWDLQCSGRFWTPMGVFDPPLALEAAPSAITPGPSDPDQTPDGPDENPNPPAQPGPKSTPQGPVETQGPQNPPSVSGQSDPSNPRGPKNKPPNNGPPKNNPQNNRPGTGNGGNENFHYPNNGNSQGPKGNGPNQNPHQPGNSPRPPDNGNVQNQNPPGNGNQQGSKDKEQHQNEQGGTGNPGPPKQNQQNSGHQGSSVDSNVFAGVDERPQGQHKPGSAAAGASQGAQHGQGNQEPGNVGPGRPGSNGHVEGAPGASNHATLHPMFIGGQLVTPAASGFSVGGTYVKPGAPVVTFAHTPISLETSGILHVGSRTMSLEPVDENITPLPVTIAGQTITPDPRGFVFAGKSLLPGGAPAAISGTPFSLGASGQLVIGTNTILLPTLATDPSQSILLTFAGQVIAPAPTGFVVGGKTVLPGGAAITVSGTRISLDKSGHLVVGSQTIALPTPGNSTPDAMTTDGSSGSVPESLTVAGQVITPAPAGFVLDGKTVLPGGTAVTISGTRISLGQSGQLVIGSSTVSLPDRDSPTPGITGTDPPPANAEGYVPGSGAESVISSPLKITACIFTFSIILLQILL